MELSIKEVARILSITENGVRNYIAWGKLPAVLKNGEVYIPEEALKNLLQKEPAGLRQRADAGRAPMGEMALLPILEELSSLRKGLEEGAQLAKENQRLFYELRRMQQELAGKDLQIEKLQQDLAFKERLYSTELEERRKAFEDRWALMERAAAQRLESEREHFQERLLAERNLCSERLQQEQERCSRRLSELRHREGFWGKLVRMMTWS